MSGSDKSDETRPHTDRNTGVVSESKIGITLDNISRSRLEGAFVSPCGTEGCRWEGFPEWPEEFPYDAFGDYWAADGEKEPET